MLSVHDPTVIFGWENRKPKAAGPNLAGDGKTWLMTEVTDGTWAFDDGSRAMPGTILLLSPRLRAGWRRATQAQENAVGFRSWREVEDSGGDEDCLAGAPFWQANGVVSPGPAAELIRQRLRPLLSLWWTGMWAKRRSDALLAIVLCDLRQLFGLDPTPTFTDDRGIDPRVLEVERLARSQLNNWRTEDMAQAAGMSRSAFSRFYRSVRGFAPGFFLNESRRRYAEAALQDLEPDMALISASIGFRNPSDFARWFRRRYDCSPSEYHQRLHGR